MDTVPLTQDHEHALRAFVGAFARAGEPHIPGYFGEEAWPHAEIVRRLSAWARGEELPDGWVPCTTSFGVEDDEIVGVVSTRHSLTDALRRCGGHVGYAVRPSRRGRGVATRMLRSALRQLSDLGIKRALLTVDTDNLPSIRVVEKCGGVLGDEIAGVTTGVRTLRYWIPL